MKLTVRKTLSILTVPVLALALSAGAASAASLKSDLHPDHDRRTPVVVFPAFHFTRLLVTVHNQTVDPRCPGSGSFEDWYLNDHPSTVFSQVCQDEMLTLTLDPDASKPISRRFANPRGVDVLVKSFGRTESAPFYEPLYQFLEAHGYRRNQDIRVAGYDSRLTPDVDDFLPRTIALIESTYYANHETPVHLVGHSNGPLYAQYLLTHTSQAWKDKFIHGFTPFAGNWPGQGLFYAVNFTGFNVLGFTFPENTANALSSARMYQSHPSTYMSSSDPDIFRDQEIVVDDLRSGRLYTPRDFKKLFRDAGLPVAGELARAYVGFVKFDKPSAFPNVDVYAEKGSGIDTSVGLKLQGLTTGQVFPFKDLSLYINRDGDVNQEDLTNDSIEVWETMACFHFELNDNHGIDHFSLPGNSQVLQRLLAHLQRPKSNCS